MILSLSCLVTLSYSLSHISCAGFYKFVVRDDVISPAERKENGLMPLVHILKRKRLIPIARTPRRSRHRRRLQRRLHAVTEHTPHHCGRPSRGRSCWVHFTLRTEPSEGRRGGDGIPRGILLHGHTWGRGRVVVVGTVAAFQLFFVGFVVVELVRVILLGLFPHQEKRKHA